MTVPDVWMRMAYRVEASSNNDNTVSMGLYAQPLIEINNLPRRIAARHEIAGMNQHILRFVAWLTQDRRTTW